MKVGDYVKILAGEHAHEGETGVIMEEIKPDLNKKPKYPWDFVVAMGGDKEDPVVFFAHELEVVYESY